MGLQAIHEPIPVERRFNSDPLDAVLVGLEVIDNGRQIARQLRATDALAGCVDHGEEEIIAVQIDCGVEWSAWVSLLAMAVGFGL